MARKSASANSQEDNEEPHSHEDGVDEESRRWNREIAEKEREPDSRHVLFTGPDYLKYDFISKKYGLLGSHIVMISRTQPSLHECGRIYLKQVPTYADFIEHLKQNVWDGLPANFSWQIRVNGRVMGQGNVTFDEDPFQRAAWEERVRALSQPKQEPPNHAAQMPQAAPGLGSMPYPVAPWPYAAPTYPAQSPAMPPPSSAGEDRRLDFYFERQQAAMSDLARVVQNLAQEVYRQPPPPPQQAPPNGTIPPAQQAPPPSPNPYPPIHIPAGYRLVPDVPAQPTAPMPSPAPIAAQPSQPASLMSGIEPVLRTIEDFSKANERMRSVATSLVESTPRAAEVVPPSAATAPAAAEPPAPPVTFMPVPGTKFVVAVKPDGTIQDPLHITSIMGNLPAAVDLFTDIKNGVFQAIDKRSEAYEKAIHLEKERLELERKQLENDRLRMALQQGQFGAPPREFPAPSHPSPSRGWQPPATPASPVAGEPEMAPIQNPNTTPTEPAPSEEEDELRDLLHPSYD